MDDQAVAWLRTQIEARLATAREACHDGSGHWWRREAAARADGVREPVGALLEGDVPETDADGEWLWWPEVVVYDEGRPSDAEFAHIALNDPADTIARCEAELAILEDHQASNRLEYGEPLCTRCSDLFPCDVIYHLAGGYKHRPGYAEHFGEAATRR